MLLAASIGVWLFYVQHQFESTQWARDEAWNLQDAALHGSSALRPAGGAALVHGHIGVHHVHHLNSRIPYYRLPQVLRDRPDLIDYRTRHAGPEPMERAADAVGRSQAAADLVSARRASGKERALSSLTQRESGWGGRAPQPRRRA